MQYVLLSSKFSILQNKSQHHHPICLYPSSHFRLRFLAYFQNSLLLPAYSRCTYNHCTTVLKKETLFLRLRVIFVVLSTKRENSEHATDCGFHLALCDLSIAFLCIFISLLSCSEIARTRKPGFDER